MAINYAATENIPILNCSNGTSNFRGSDASLTAFETAVTNYRGLFINAAGNDTRNNDNNTGGFPRAQFRPNNFLSVGSLDSNGSRSSFSNWGVNTVDIFAPGGSILSTWPTALSNHDSGRPGYRTVGGTSMAAPMVAGVAALMLSVNPDLTSQQLRTNIRDSANWVNITHPSGFLNLGSTTISVRRLNAEAAVGTVANFTIRNLSDTTVSITGVAMSRQLTGSVVIPEFLNGRTVTQIGDNAFNDQSQLTHITIPESITHIGNNTFHTNTRVDWFGRYSFKANTFLGLLGNQTDFTIPNTIAGKQITIIGSRAFYNLTQLSRIVIPSGVTTIDSNAFQNTNNASIYLIGRTTVPITFDINWNSSGNPVYLNGVLCTHSSKTFTNLDYATHGYLCNRCRTVTSKENHSYGAPYIPGRQANY